MASCIGIEMSSAVPLIEFRDIKKAFVEKVVLNGVNCSFFEGEITTIIGKSGVGKSVFLKHIVGLLEPDAGEILINGVPISKKTTDAMREFRSKVSYMFQSNALFDSMTVFDNIALPLVEMRAYSKEEIRERVFLRARQLELNEVLEKYPAQISGGMQKRAALARALVTNPKVVLFDEPTAGLDPLRKNAVFSMVHHYQKRFGFTGIIVSHDIPDVFYISDRVAILNNGKIIFEGTPIELEQADNPEIKMFIEGEFGLIDKLTGLYTEVELEKAMQNALEIAGVKGTEVAIALFSLGNLEEVDEHVGHIASHKIFQCLAGAIMDFFGQNAVAGRTGTNEIVAVIDEMQDKKGSGAEEILMQFGDMLRSRPFLKKESYPRVCKNFSIRASIGKFKRNVPCDVIINGLRRQLVDIASLKCPKNLYKGENRQ